MSSQEGTDPGAGGERAARTGKRNRNVEREPEPVADESTDLGGQDASPPQMPPPPPPAPPVTEKPVPQPRGVVRYVVSVDEATGFIVKVEKQENGGSKELSQEEYMAAFAYASYAAPYYAAYASSLYDPYSTPAGQAYLKAVIDVWKSLAA